MCIISALNLLKKQSIFSPTFCLVLNKVAGHVLFLLATAEILREEVGCKWVFRVKRNPDGSVERYKARFVAKGFHQQHDIDYNETFSSVIKPATIRNVLCLTISRSWPLRQLDVKNVFLHVFLKEDVYMTQPPSFIDQARPSFVCKLNKAIYGLKQAPHAWFHRMTSFLLSVGFVQS
ncbi:putative RNA-directed DNA polymerase [Rosa chinensis]|uniref:Putative RNA-directed DNA polymerase n=1 Tax=Rosa chinensis TaxID=74649 RepID=A0A2P6RM40_ROSCH|nr:putative RNA-directed DNA polymerase [Rosa chinensis]